MVVYLLSLMNASPQYFTLDSVYDENLQLYLDFLVSCSPKFKQLNLAKFNMKLNAHI
jgi:hypothetical protein